MKEIIMVKHSRPLSPHLEIYRPQITMVMSILHRITGVALYFGFALITIWLVAAATSNVALQIINGIFAHWLGQLILFGFTWGLFHHMFGGIRHFVWDMGAGFSRKARFGMAWFSLFAALILTLLVWAFILWS